MTRHNGKQYCPVECPKSESVIVIVIRGFRVLLCIQNKCTDVPTEYGVFLKNQNYSIGKYTLQVSARACCFFVPPAAPTEGLRVFAFELKAPLSGMPGCVPPATALLRVFCDDKATATAVQQAAAILLIG